MNESSLFARQVAYLRDVESVLELAGEYVPPAVIATARHLVEHSEAPIGLGLVGWNIVESSSRVPRTLIVELRRLTEGAVVDGVDMPVDLEEFAIDDDF